MELPHDSDLTVSSPREEIRDDTMPFDHTQESFWDSASVTQSLGTDSLENNLFEPLGLTIDTSSPHYIRGLAGETIGLSYSDWGGSIHGDLLPGGAYSPGTSRSNTFPDPNSRSQAGPRRPSAEAIARRRRQNRVSQAAWRARNKELVEELRQEIAEHTEYNQTMQESLRSLLKTTESLKGAIENALAVPAPKGEKKENSGECQLLSPESSVDTTATRFDLDAPHDP